MVHVTRTGRVTDPVRQWKERETLPITNFGQLSQTIKLIFLENVNASFSSDDHNHMSSKSIKIIRSGIPYLTLCDEREKWNYSSHMI